MSRFPPPLGAMLSNIRTAHQLRPPLLLPTSTSPPPSCSSLSTPTSPYSHVQHTSSPFNATTTKRNTSLCGYAYLSCRHGASVMAISTVHKRYVHTDKKNSIRLTIIGAPGSGKGTQSTKIEKDFGVSTISTGQLLRRMAEESSDLGKSVSAILKSGGLVGDDIMMDLIKRELSNQKNGWLLDGYPRNPKQAAQLDDLLHSIHQPLTLVFHLKVPEHVILERIHERWMHPASGRTYNMSFSPPKVPGKDDVTGEPLVRRVDDNDEAVHARLRTYHEATYPLLEYYHKKGILIPVESPTSLVGYVKIKEVLQDLVTNGTLKR